MSKVNWPRKFRVNCAHASGAIIVTEVRRQDPKSKDPKDKVPLVIRHGDEVTLTEKEYAAMFEAKVEGQQAPYHRSLVVAVVDEPAAPKSKEAPAAPKEKNGNGKADANSGADGKK